MLSIGQLLEIMIEYQPKIKQILELFQQNDTKNKKLCQLKAYKVYKAR